MGTNAASRSGARGTVGTALRGTALREELVRAARAALGSAGGESAATEQDEHRILLALAQLDPTAALRCLIERGEAERVGLTAVLDALAERRVAIGADQSLRILRDFADVVEPRHAASLWKRLDPSSRESELLASLLARAPQSPELLRLAVEEAIRVGDPAGHALASRLGRAEPQSTNARVAWKARAKLPPGDGPVLRIALLSTFTIDPLVPHLDLECRELGLSPEIFVAPFNTWAQQVFGEDTELWRFAPDVVFLSPSIDDLIPELAAAPSSAGLAELGAAAVERVLAVARAFSEKSRSVLVVHGLVSAYRDPFGLLGARLDGGRRARLAELDERLASGLRELPRAYPLDLADLVLRRRGGPAGDPKMRHLASMHLGGSVLGEVARAYAGFVAPLAGLTRKCVVLDLDNTLWGGIVGEDGPHGIKLGDTAPGSEFRDFQRYLKSLLERGFLLAIASKNNPDDALEVIRDHDGMILREDDFAAQRIGWQPKPESIREIAEELNIGLDSFVFLDDNPKERAQMREFLPEVLTVDLPTDPARYREAIETLPQLQTLSITEEDRSRTSIYRARAKRETARSQAGSLESYLGSLDIEVVISRVNAASAQRIEQMLKRTNQFNLTTRRYDAAAIARFIADPAIRFYALKASDRYGDHGIVASALVKTSAEEWQIDSFLLSCRVIGYGIETALLAVLAEEAREAGAPLLVGECVHTPKNVPARDFYARHGFSGPDPVDGVERWSSSADNDFLVVPEWIAAKHDA